VLNMHPIPRLAAKIRIGINDSSQRLSGALHS
jgi:hypothetical protein